MTGSYGVALSRSDDLQLSRHPSAPKAHPSDDPRGWCEWALSLTSPLAVDLFCGGGGLSLGLEQAGCSVALAVDIDARAVATHEANFAGPALQLDLADENQVEQLLELLCGIPIDILAGGPPCQPFSRAGRSKIRSLVESGARSAVDKRRDLWRTFIAIAQELRPRAVFFENVPDLALANDSLIVRQMTAQLEAAGFDVDYRLLDASRFGVPQRRQRLILVATSEGRFNWPSELEPVTLRDAIGDLPSLGHGTGDRELRYDSPISSFQQKARLGMTGANSSVIFDHMTRPVRDDDREAFTLMDGTTSYSDLPNRLKRYRDDIFSDKYNRLEWARLSRSITAHLAKDGYWYIHPSEPRTLTVREAARIQTFPDSFRFAGTRSHAFTQIGNAVPPTLAIAVTESILASFESTTLHHDFRSGRHRWFRDQILAWTGHRRTAWLDIGNPWVVLVSTICGRRGHGDELAERLLREWPEPTNATPRQVADLTRTLNGYSNIHSVVERCARAGRSICYHGWDDDHWASEADLGPSATRWVRALGLEKHDIVATTGVQRVAARFEGVADARTSAEVRLVVAQLVGAESHPVRVTAAMAALAEGVCRPTNPHCSSCPILDYCHWTTK
ncbi:MAG: DNA (cytosine-5-)-methyltransferase [bacterium]|nr:DNA (cytosine-5-)-methyltransferase [bacterium]